MSRFYLPVGIVIFLVAACLLFLQEDLHQENPLVGETGRSATSHNIGLPESIEGLTRTKASEELFSHQTPYTNAPETHPTDTLEVTLILRGSGIPVANGDIVIFPENGFPLSFDRRIASMLPSKIASALQGLGDHYTTDAKGKVVIPRPDAGYWIYARTTDHYMVPYQPLTVVSEISLELAATGPVSVFVVDEQGNPLIDVEIALVSGANSFEPIHCRATTDETGHAELELLEFVRERTWDLPLTIVPLGLFRSDVGIPVPLEGFQNGEVKMTLPASGSVEVLVLNEQGEPGLGQTLDSMKAIFEMESSLPSMSKLVYPLNLR